MGARVELGVRVPLRDGALLAADLYLPEGDGPFPAVVTRTPYGKALFPVEAVPLAEAGYAVLVQDVRGRHDSEGRFTPYLQEGPDGFDTVEWVAGQPWCDGRVGMFGASYGGWAQWAAARERPPHLRTFVSSVSAGLWTEEWPWVNGILWGGGIEWLHRTADRVNQPLEAYPLPGPPAAPVPLSRYQERFGRWLPVADDWLRQPTPGGCWEALTLQPADFAALDLPVLHVTGWFDGCQRGTQWLYEQMREHSPARDRQALVVGAWDHTLRQMQRSYDGLDFGDTSVVDYAGMRVRWFDRWLRGSGGEEAPAGARVFVTGANAWQQHDAFPPEALPHRWHLHADGALTERQPTSSGEASFVHDPSRPVLTRPADAPASYPLLRREGVHARDDVLVWRSDPLVEPVRLVGRVEASLHVSSTAPDTDWFVEVADVAPDGTAFLVAHGQLRARYREGMHREVLAKPGVPYLVTVQLTPRAHELRRGHRLAVAVASSGAPLWEPHPGHGGDLYAEEGWQTARNTVHTGGEHPSVLVLPVP